MADPALLSRFDGRVHFAAPDASTRAAIFARYAKQLSPDELSRLGDLSEGLSGRDILDVCRQAERRWACLVLQDVREGEGKESSRESSSGVSSRRPKSPIPLPPLGQYEAAVVRRFPP